MTALSSALPTLCNPFAPTEPFANAAPHSNGSAHSAAPSFPFLDGDEAPGRPLCEEALSRATAWDAQTVERWLRSACDQLMRLHRRGHIHAALDLRAVRVLDTGRLLLPPPAEKAHLPAATGWAAPEQVGREPMGAQPGPWTDVYALAAMAYLLVARRPPEQAADRIMGLPLKALNTTAGAVQHRRWFAGIEQGLAITCALRPQSLPAFMALLGLPERRSRVRPEPELDSHAAAPTAAAASAARPAPLWALPQTLAADAAGLPAGGASRQAQRPLRTLIEVDDDPWADDHAPLRDADPGPARLRRAAWAGALTLFLLAVVWFVNDWQTWKAMDRMALAAMPPAAAAAGASGSAAQPSEALTKTDPGLNRLRFSSTAPTHRKPHAAPESLHAPAAAPRLGLSLQGLVGDKLH